MTIDVGVEVDALFLDLSESGEGKYLKSAGIGEDRTIPVHKPVETAELLDQLVAGIHECRNCRRDQGRCVHR